MQIWLEVVKELIDFALGKERVRSLSSSNPDTYPLALPTADSTNTAYQFREQATVETADKTLETTIDDAQPVGEALPTVSFTHGLEPERMYIAEPNTPCFLRPVRALDSVIAVLEYGAPVDVGKLEGRWAQVRAGGSEGWVLKDVVVNDKDLVYPVLEEGIVYEANHPETVKLRTLIGDEFSAMQLTLPLLDIEYVSYRLGVTGRTINWTSVRPRTAGRWQQLLRGVKGAYISIEPTTHAIMETVMDDGLGLIEYVCEVHPDESIVVSGIDLHIPGRYRKRTLSKQEWRETHPVFIEITTNGL